MQSTASDSAKRRHSFVKVIFLAIIIFLFLAISFMALVLINISAPKGGNGLTLPQLQGQTSRGQNTAAASVGQNDIIVAPATRFDHARGSLSAPITIVEFVDLECPASKEFHPVMKQIFNEYQGKVAWIFHHYPVDSLHLKARKEAEAAECAAELGGNEKFWQYVDFIFQITPANDGLDPAQLPEIAAAVGLDRQKFSICLASGKYAAKVDNDLRQALIAIASGRQGTPYSVVMVGSEKIPISGAAKYEQMKTAIDSLLAELERRK